MKPEQTQLHAARKQGKTSGTPQYSGSTSDITTLCDINPQLHQRRLLQLCILSLLTVLICAGCKQHSNATVAADPVGSYVLVSVDGNKVPCRVEHEGHAVPIQSGTFLINADGTCSSKILLAGQNSAVEVKATYTQEGSKLTMQWAGAGRTVGTIEGDTFTMANEGMTLAYQKQKKNSS